MRCKTIKINPNKSREIGGKIGVSELHLHPVYHDFFTSTFIIGNYNPMFCCINSEYQFINDTYQKNAIDEMALQPLPNTEPLIASHTDNVI